MNELIQELAREAGFKVNWQHEDVQAIKMARFEKFAESIIQECVAITDDLVNRSTDGTWTSNELYTDYNGALFEVKRRIHETFGVE